MTDNSSTSTVAPTTTEATKVALTTTEAPTVGHQQ